MRIVLLAALVAMSTARRVAPERVRPNDNRVAAGVMRNGVLALRLDARLAPWYPDGDDAPGASVPSFAEVGHAASIPGPLIRVNAGTDVEVTVVNSLADTLTIRGLHARGSSDDAALSRQPLVLAPRAQATIRFRLDAAGTYYYYGSTNGRVIDWRTGIDAQLTGAIVVDPRGARTRADRIFVIGMWSDTVGRANTVRTRVLGVVNGRAWPHTERIGMTQGDTANWRVINASGDLHPMHLHGTYFTVHARGDGVADSAYAPDLRDYEVTEMMLPGGVMTMKWSPERAGNWLFHCHIPEHFSPRGAMGMPRATPSSPAHSSASHALGDMNGLVLGVVVKPGRHSAAARPLSARRDIRLSVLPRAGGSDTAPLFSYAIDGVRTRDGDPGAPALVLVRGEPVRIRVHNTLSVPTAVHWHGIELESYYDGVPGFSGDARRPSPIIAPHDSFDVQFTPPRAGTFIYHTHVDEERQQRGGLAGPLIVVDPGSAYDTLTSKTFLLSTPLAWRDEVTSVLINGRSAPDTLRLVAGVHYRLRFINMTNRKARNRFELRRDSTLLSWRLLARDGAELSPTRQGTVRARQELTIGQTLDVDFAPADTGIMRLDVMPFIGPRLATVPIRVSPAR